MMCKPNPGKQSLNKLQGRSNGAGTRRNGVTSNSFDLHYPDTIARPVLGFQVRTDESRADRSHSHAKAQLLYTVSGFVEIESDAGNLVVPPGSVTWIPSGVAHCVRAGALARFGCVYLDPDLSSDLPDRTELFQINPLVRELLLRFSDGPSQDEGDEGRQARMAGVLVDELASSRSPAKASPLPRDPRLLRLVNALLAEPERRLTIEQWGKQVGASHRTLSRLFQKEVGKSFSAWRQELHVDLAVRALEAGTPVATIAFRLGYDSPSAFIAMFKKNTGHTPGNYADARLGGAQRP